MKLFIKQEESQNFLLYAVSWFGWHVRSLIIRGSHPLDPRMLAQKKKKKFNFSYNTKLRLHEGWWVYCLQIFNHKGDNSKVPFALRVSSRLRFLPLFFFFYAWTVTSHGSLFTHCSYTVWHCSCTVHILKNIKNGSHDTIYTFKNYFAIVFSVFSFQFSATISSIQTDP